MVLKKKNRIQALVIGLAVFLTLNCFVLGQPPVGPEIPKISENRAPKILSIEVSNEKYVYTIIIEIQDEDPPEFLMVGVQHEKGKVRTASLIESKILGNDGVFISIFEISFTLKPGFHTFTVVAEDSEGSRTETIITIDVPELNFPPQIFLIEVNIQENTFTITVEVVDEDPHSVILQIEGTPLQKSEEIEVTPISDSMRRGIFVSNPIPLVPGLQALTITARDSQGNEKSIQIPIESPKVNQPPQITSLEVGNVGDKYTVTIGVIDEDPSSINVTIEGYLYIEFSEGGMVAPVSDSLKKGTFVSDPFILKSGSYTFAIVAEDSQGESTLVQITTNVPKSVIYLLLPLFLLALAVVILMVLFLRRKPEQAPPEEASPVKVEEPKTVQCPSCKKKNVKEALYCEHCGTPLKPVDELEKKRALLDLERRFKTREISEEEYHRLKEELEKSF